MIDYIWVFLVGGIICVIGQILMDTTRLTAPRILVIFVIAGAVLTALGLYQPIVDLGHSGATVPLPGFGYSLAKGAIDGAASGGFSGALTGGLNRTAAGVCFAIVFGYLVALVFNPKSKR